jgi:hypothetical protein
MHVNFHVFPSIPTNNNAALTIKTFMEAWLQQGRASMERYCLEEDKTWLRNHLVGWSWCCLL